MDELNTTKVSVVQLFVAPAAHIPFCEKLPPAVESQESPVVMLHKLYVASPSSHKGPQSIITGSSLSHAPEERHVPAESEFQL